MDTFLLIALAFMFIALTWMSWRYLSLRRSADAYARVLSRAAKADNLTRDLPPDIQHLEALSSAVNALAAAFDQQLSTSEAQRLRLAAILDQMTDGVLIADFDGRIQLANPAAEKLLGEGQSLPGRSVVVALRHHPYGLGDEDRHHDEQDQRDESTHDLSPLHDRKNPQYNLLQPYCACA